MIRNYVATTSQPGIVTRHVFSSGAYYDPANLSFGRIVGCDEHTVAVGAGFDRHAHRGVVIVSWVIGGTLRHEDDDGRVLSVAPRQVLVQATGDGIRHAETNGGMDELVFVQTTLLADTPRSVDLTVPPATLPGGGTVLVGVPAAFAVRAGKDLLGFELG